MSDNDIIREFREVYPDNHIDAVKEIRVHGGSLQVKTEPDKTIAPSITRPLLEEGWAVTSHASSGDSDEGHKFWFKRVNLVEREVTRTITETQTVPTTQRVEQ